MKVFAHQYGRLGNNLFQKAAAIGYATKHGLDYHLCPWYAKNNIAFGHRILKEQGHQYQELPFDEKWRKGKRNIVLDGYWQSAKYFDHCREEVLKAFGYDWSLKEGWCSIHVRRGDYLLYPDKHPVVTADYLERAIYHIYYDTGLLNFMVFSDDIPYCKAVLPNLRYQGFTFEYSEGRTAEEDLVLGSCCEHNIISNSTFSWWQAWLGRNENKIVISPSKDNWFGSGNSHLDTSDIIPESWIQIKY
jgi:hypothetical protein